MVFNATFNNILVEDHLHVHCEFEPHSGEMYLIQHYAIKFVSDLRQVGGIFQLLQFPPPIKKFTLHVSLLKSPLHQKPPSYQARFQGWVMVFNATFNNILVEDTRIPRKNHQQTCSVNFHIKDYLS
jgi:hypothetical protein